MVQININKAQVGEEEELSLLIIRHIRMIGGGIRTSRGTTTCNNRGIRIGSIITTPTTIASSTDLNRLPEEDAVVARAEEEAVEEIGSTITTIISRIGTKTNGTMVEEEEEVDSTISNTHSDSITTTTNNSIMIVEAHLTTIKRMTTIRTATTTVDRTR